MLLSAISTAKLYIYINLKLPQIETTVTLLMVEREGDSFC